MAETLTAISDSSALGNTPNQPPIFDPCCNPGEGNGVADGDVADDPGKKLNNAEDKVLVIVGLCGVGCARRCGVGLFSAAAAF
jgi:hypothetical protein